MDTKWVYNGENEYKTAKNGFKNGGKWCKNGFKIRGKRLKKGNEWKNFFW
jgi:hypothetical protein